MEEKEFLKRMKELYLPSDKEFSLVDVPEIQFVMIDCEGNPEGEAYTQAVKWLFTVIHPIKSIVRKRMGKNFVEPPLEALLWADDIEDFIAGNKDKYKGRMMIVIPDWVDGKMFAQAVAKSEKRLGKAPEGLRLESFNEGKCVQIMHVGPYSEEPLILARMYKEFLPENNLIPNGHYHEIYLNDPNRVAPEKLKTVLRQPVRQCREASSH